MAMTLYYLSCSEKGPIPTFLTEKKYEPLVKLIAEQQEDISNDSLYKIVRQLEFWTNEDDLSDDELLEVTKRLIHVATWRKRPDFQVPKKRFGRTELQIPIITCGTMRFQHTWMPDTLPITISKKKVLKTPSQENMMEIVRNCIKMGINHIETARVYGTSEIQLMHALTTLIERGDIKRSDFILQTKIFAETKEDIKKKFEQSWQHFKDFEYIDLLSFHCASSPQQVERLLDESDDGAMSALLDYKKQGKIRHIGFSTHGSAETIMKLVESNKFDYVNLHYHFFGCYHAEGTPDTRGGHGLAAVVKRATELDMGIFQISPVDKGGQLYRPSATVCRLIGPNLNPISFAAIHAWQNGIHTSSVGFARPEDLDEILEAAELYTKKEGIEIVQKAATCLTDHARETLSKEWHEKGLVNIPSFYDKSTLGVGIGHMLWCYNMIHAFGMYETAHGRYDMLEKTNKWDHKKPFEENDKKM
jgi:predicted aldo/keto reductase-like oxidoreductase